MERTTRIAVMLILALVSFLGMNVAAEAPDEFADAAQACHVFVHGQEARIAVPEAAQGVAQRWRVLDDTLAEIRHGVMEAATGPTASISVGTPGVGWYRVEFLAEGGECVAFTTAAVLPRLPGRANHDSPVCLDVALSWLAKDDPRAWEKLVRLASLARASWVRDRVRWREMETSPGVFAGETKYDSAAGMQREAGLGVLQVFHDVPAWARDEAAEGIRPATDLRRLYRFCEAMGKRFRGRVNAWEPWNEGNAGNFGGYATDALCSHQKAAYLGFKAGDPGITVCWGPFGGVNTEAQADAILANVTWPYYDVYSIHSYDWPHAYASLWGPARRASAGRPIWVTECDRGMKADPASAVGDFTHEFERLKAAFITQSYACSLFSGSSRHFHFILGPYMEGENTIQFGLLRDDYTPRMSYVALAAAGRFLDAARCLGKWDSPGTDEAHVYAFRAQPDGEPRDMLVAWVEKEADWPDRGAQTMPWPLPEELRVEKAYDFLGRELPAAPPAQITSFPFFALLPEGALNDLPLDSAPPVALRQGEPAAVVLQFDTPSLAPVIRQRAWTPEPERVFSPGAPVDCRLVVYNFSRAQAQGSVSLDDAPEAWSFSQAQWDLAVPPMDRSTLEFTMTAPATGAPGAEWVVFRGDFGPAGRPVLAFQAFLE